LVGSLGALIVLAWVALWAWGASPLGGYLGHNPLRAEESPVGGALGLGLLFVVGWTIMTIAMMLPTSVPLVLLFHRIVRDRVDSARLIGLLLIGYLLVWTAFGAVAHAADLGLHGVVARSEWLGANTWLLGALPLLLAGAYQFSGLKYQCLKKCRSPLTFITEHWHGKRERLEAFRLGVHHGLFCVGCCWSLMLLMFAQGLGSVAWMLLLGAVMAAEKNLPWGRRLSAPLGVALLTAGLLLVAQHAIGALSSS
jgi:predicted metal-binding membrane protein